MCLGARWLATWIVERSWHAISRFLEEALSLAGHFSPYSSVFGQMISTKSREVVSFVATATYYIPFEHGRAAMPCIAGMIEEGGTKGYFITLEYTYIYPEFLIQFVQTDDDQRREKRLEIPNPPSRSAR